ncbi:MAG: histidine kinase, partial [Flavobacterium sp.]
MNSSLKNNLRIGLGLSLLILFITSLASYISIQNLIKSADLVSHSNRVMSSLDAVISTLKDAETGQRGYLLTDNKDFLEPYNGAEDHAKDLLNIIESETKDNPFQQQNVKVLQNIVNSRLSIIEKTIKEKSLGGNVGVAELLNGKVYMDDARNTIKKMQAEEQRILTLRTQELNKISSYTPALILIAAALAILITFFFYRKVSSDFTLRVR